MNKNLLGLVVVILGLLFFYSLYRFGLFMVFFEENLCYSKVITEIHDKVRIANESKDFEKVEALDNLLDSLPLNGYETNCKDIVNAIEIYN